MGQDWLALDPVDHRLARDWVRTAHDRWGLTTTEGLAVLAVLVGYTTTAASALALGIAPNGIKNYRTAVFVKLGVRDTPTLARRCWPAYAPLRDRALRRALAREECIAA